MSLNKKLREKNFKLKKKYGQNFISDYNLLSFIVDTAEVDKETVVVEIGAGAGTLTKVIAEKAKAVLAIEIDKDLKTFYDQEPENFKNVTFLFKDVMKVNDELIKDFLEKQKVKKYIIIANLPYYITTPIVMKFLESAIKPEKMILMVQREVAERFVASKDTKAYGALSVILKMQSDVKYIKTVKRHMFLPVPDVDSAIIEIKLKDVEKKRRKQIAFTKKIIKSAFARRRKTLINNLSVDFHMSKEELVNILNELNIDKNVRAENLELDEFLAISEKIYL